MKRFFRFVLLFIFQFSVLIPLSAEKIIKTEGYGSTEAAARAEALEQLAFTFHTDVKSTVAAESYVSTSTSKSGKNSKKTQNSVDKKVLLSTDMPVLGAEIKITDNGEKGKAKVYAATATMNSEVCVPLYVYELEKLKDIIEPKLRELAKKKGSDKEAAYISLYGDYAQFQKLCMALTVMKSDKIPVLSKSPEEFTLEYTEYTKTVTSIEKACQILVDSLPKAYSGIYVNGPQFEGDGAMTPFSRVMAQTLMNKLGNRTALEKFNSSYYLQGTYYMVPGSVNADDMMLGYYLMKNDGTVAAASSLVKIPYDVYSQYKYRPSSYSLTQEIENGNVSDPEFGVSIRINGDRNPREFKNGDSLIVEARATHQCYIYVIGHVFNEKGEEFSYLFPMDPYADGKEMFVKKIGAKDLNKWVVLNPEIEGMVANIEIIPPYGEEALQIFAITENDFDEAVNLIPDYRESDDYYIISGSPAAVSERTRGLAIKKVTDKASRRVMKAESSITYSTHK